eukprot:7619013-Pyramimonas_sp.AAC.1
MATIRIFFQNGATGSARGGWARHAGSLPRARGSELGVHDPVFWGPAGLTAGGVANSFAHKRL